VPTNVVTPTTYPVRINLSAVHCHRREHHAKYTRLAVAMWRQACVIFLMAATVRAQDQVPAVASTEERMADRKRVEVFRYYTELRRGTTEDVAVLLLLKSGFLTLPASPVPGITPVSLELQSTKEVRVSKVRYPKPYRRNFAFKASRIPVAGAIYFPIRLKLRAGSTAQLGMHALRAKLTYQVVDDGGVSSSLRRRKWLWIFRLLSLITMRKWDGTRIGHSATSQQGTLF
jgi:hypothetical protein